jgi:hypothetical protein
LYIASPLAPMSSSNGAFLSPFVVTIREEEE